MSSKDKKETGFNSLSTLLGSAKQRLSRSSLPHTHLQPKAPEIRLAALIALLEISSNIDTAVRGLSFLKYHKPAYEPGKPRQSTDITTAIGLSQITNSHLEELEKEAKNDSSLKHFKKGPTESWSVDAGRLEGRLKSYHLDTLKNHTGLRNRLALAAMISSTHNLLTKSFPEYMSYQHNLSMSAGEYESEKASLVLQNFIQHELLTQLIQVVNELPRNIPFLQSDVVAPSTELVGYLKGAIESQERLIASTASKRSFSLRRRSTPSASVAFVQDEMDKAINLFKTNIRAMFAMPTEATLNVKITDAFVSVESTKERLPELKKQFEMFDYNLRIAEGREGDTPTLVTQKTIKDKTFRRSSHHIIELPLPLFLAINKLQDPFNWDKELERRKDKVQSTVSRFKSQAPADMKTLSPAEPKYAPRTFTAKCAQIVTNVLNEAQEVAKCSKVTQSGTNVTFMLATQKDLRVLAEQFQQLKKTYGFSDKEHPTQVEGTKRAFGFGKTTYKLTISTTLFLTIANMDLRERSHKSETTPRGSDAQNTVPAATTPLSVTGVHASMFPAAGSPDGTAAPSPSTTAEAKQPSAALADRPQPKGPARLPPPLTEAQKSAAAIRRSGGVPTAHSSSASDRSSSLYMIP